MSTSKAIPPEEKRRYLRLNSVFPVQFRLLSLDGSRFFSDWIQGFTNNIGKGGICLRVNNLPEDLAARVKALQAKCFLEVEVPLGNAAVSAQAAVVWVREIAGQQDKLLIGLAYEKILADSNSRLMRYVWLKKLFVPVMGATMILLGLGLAANSYLNIKLTEGNKALVGQLVTILQDSRLAQKKIRQISRDKDDLQLKIQALQVRIQALDEEKKKLEEGAWLQELKNARKIGEMKAQMEKLGREKAPLQEQLIALQHKEGAVTEELLQLHQKRAVIEKANFDKMYQWLTVHQNPRSGLVMSFEGDSDVSNWGFIYDESLAAQAFTKFLDFERARKILDFFAKKAKRREGLFLNAYYVDDGSPAEYIAHAGPNIWLGIAMLHYTDKSSDGRYLPLAEEIAQAIIGLQDEEGGIRGGPNVAWYSTEHNLDGYAFFDMLYSLTGQKKYLEAKEKVLRWLVKHTYDRPGIPIMRGKGDSTIATDTYAWSISALGPGKLEELGMSPDKVVEFAEENCAVEVTFLRPEGTPVKVKGFDFAAQRHLARGGVVSSEWTAQMILAFKIMADFYHRKDMDAKASSYESKADDYLAQLCNMIISSPSPSGQGEGCLPYASADSVDTGHGWVTPKGKATGCVSGTVYTIFAYYDYNPLSLKE